MQLIQSSHLNNRIGK